jgi:CheY-like chemotaxis protein
VLLVEDNFLFAATVRAMLEQFGCIVLGPHAEVGEAIAVAEHQPADIGLLDITIVGGTSAPVAYRLRERSTPFFFITGHANLNMLPEDLRSSYRLSKPFDRTALETAMLRFQPD